MEVSEHGEMRCTLITAGGKTFTAEATFDLESVPRARIFVKMTPLPVDIAGEYHIKVEQPKEINNERQWVEVADIPFEVVLKQIPSPQDQV